MTLNLSDRTALLALARRSIEMGLAEGHLQPTPAAPSETLERWRASFVTLRKHDDLRGCVGSIEPRFTLAEDVWRNAWAAAFADPRFPALTTEEYPSIDLDISVLTEPERLPVQTEQALLATLRPGRDGLILQLDGARATFLPTVWETIADPTEFVRHLKVKAGWPSSFWSPDIAVWRYETESFGEEDSCQQE